MGGGATDWSPHPCWKCGSTDSHICPCIECGSSDPHICRTISKDPTWRGIPPDTFYQLPPTEPDKPAGAAAGFHEKIETEWKGDQHMFSPGDLVDWNSINLDYDENRPDSPSFTNEVNKEVNKEKERLKTMTTNLRKMRSTAKESTVVGLSLTGLPTLAEFEDNDLAESGDLQYDVARFRASLPNIPKVDPDEKIFLGVGKLHDDGKIEILDPPIELSFTEAESLRRKNSK